MDWSRESSSSYGELCTHMQIVVVEVQEGTWTLAHLFVLNSTRFLQWKKSITKKYHFAGKSLKIDENHRNIAYGEL